MITLARNAENNGCCHSFQSRRMTGMHHRKRPSTGKRNYKLLSFRPGVTARSYLLDRGSVKRDKYQFLASRSYLSLPWESNFWTWDVHLILSFSSLIHTIPPWLRLSTIWLFQIWAFRLRESLHRDRKIKVSRQHFTYQYWLPVLVNGQLSTLFNWPFFRQAIEKELFHLCDISSCHGSLRRFHNYILEN